MFENIIPMKWKRPDSVEYPKVWHRFMARDLNSNELVEYRIEDLSQSKAEEAYDHMRENYMVDEPLSRALEGYLDDVHFEDFCFAWRSTLSQKMPLVCYRDGSDEIVGLNWNYITHKDDKFSEKFTANNKSPVTKTLFDIAFMLYENFDPFEFYGVDEYLASFGLSVNKKYRGRAIGDHLLATRKIICQEFGVKLTHTIFSSDYSSQNAENVGFKTNAAIRYDEVNKMHPEYNLSHVKSTEMAIKSLLF